MSMLVHRPRDLSAFDEVDRSFNRMLSNFFGGSPLYNEEYNRWSPRVDVSETETSYEVKADLPGVNKENINVSLDKNVLTIDAQMRQEKEAQEGEGEQAKEHNGTQALIRERIQGSYIRRIHLSRPVSWENSNGEYRDGVLTLTIPKKQEEDTARKIEIH